MQSWYFEIMLTKQNLITIIFNLEAQSQKTEITFLLRTTGKQRLKGKKVKQLLLIFNTGHVSCGRRGLILALGIGCARERCSSLRGSNRLHHWSLIPDTNSSTDALQLTCHHSECRIIITLRYCWKKHSPS